MRRLKIFAAAVAAAVSAFAGGRAEAQANIGGAWSADQGCAPAAPRFVFGARTMEVHENGRRRFSVEVRYERRGAQTVVTITRLGAGITPGPGMPAVGDVATFRRDGAQLHPVSIVNAGRTVNAPPDGPPLYHCR